MVTNGDIEYVEFRKPLQPPLRFEITHRNSWQRPRYFQRSLPSLAPMACKSWAQKLGNQGRYFVSKALNGR